MFINGDGNWVNIINDAVVTYKNNIHSTFNMTPVDDSNNPEKVKNFTFTFKNIIFLLLRILNINLKLVIMLEM